MKLDIADKWVKALRSGEYKQGQQFLCKVGETGKESFCCLGVLCDIYQKEVGDLEIRPGSYFRYYDNCSGYLPEKVKNWSGIASDRGYRGQHKSSLLSLNDDAVSFEHIADIIEQEKETL